MYTSIEITEIVKGELIGKDNRHLVITQLLTDSRRLRDPQQTLFFAIKAERNNILIIFKIYTIEMFVVF